MADLRKLLADRFSGVVHNMDDGTETADAILRLLTEQDLVVVEGKYLADLRKQPKVVKVHSDCPRCGYEAPCA